MNHIYNSSYGDPQPQFSNIAPPLFTYSDENLDFDFSSLFDDDKDLFVTPNLLQNSGMNINLQHGYLTAGAHQQGVQAAAPSAHQNALQSLGSTASYPSHQDISDDGK